MPLGNSITWGTGDTDGFPGYRDHLYSSLEGDGYDVDFVGSMTDPSGPHDRHSEGHTGKTARRINGWNNEKTGPNAYGENIDDWLDWYEPNIVLYFIGTNDITPVPPGFGFTPEETAVDVSETLSKIARAGACARFQEKLENCEVQL
jgi:lysophospholipase L1-like esterase